MPQFDPSLLPSQIFWLLVSFAVLYFLISTFILPRMADMIEERQDRIDHDLDRAAEMRAEAEVVMQEYDHALIDARKQSEAMLQAAQEDIKVLIREKNAVLSARLSQELDAAEERIKKAKAKALDDVRGIAEEAAQSVFEKLTGQKLKKQEAQDAVARILKIKEAA